MLLEGSEIMLDQRDMHMEEVEMEDIFEESIIDIDVNNNGNQLAVVEYVEDLYAHYRSMELIKNTNMEDNDTMLKQDEYVLSAEDLAWADSCFNADIELSETNMDSLKEALLDILDQHSELLAPSTNEHDNSDDINDPNILPSVVDEGTSHTAETSINDHLEEEFTNVLFSLEQQPFLPNYKDEMMNIQYSDDDAGFVFSETVIELPSDDIFKVWDLDIPAEEDELDKQLKEALSSKVATKVLKKKGSEMESFDSLVESIADLSLK